MMNNSHISSLSSKELFERYNQSVNNWKVFVGQSPKKRYKDISNQLNEHLHPFKQLEVVLKGKPDTAKIRTVLLPKVENMTTRIRKIIDNIKRKPMMISLRDLSNLHTAITLPNPVDDPLTSRSKERVQELLRRTLSKIAMAKLQYNSLEYGRLRQIALVQNAALKKIIEKERESGPPSSGSEEAISLYHKIVDYDPNKVESLSTSPGGNLDWVEKFTLRQFGSIKSMMIVSGWNIKDISVSNGPEDDSTLIVCFGNPQKKAVEFTVLDVKYFTFEMCFINKLKRERINVFIQDNDLKAPACQIPESFLHEDFNEELTDLEIENYIHSWSRAIDALITFIL